MNDINKINKFKKNRKLVSIRRENIDPNSIQGFILGVSKDLLLIQYVYDFNLDGLMILRMSDITEVKSDSTAKLQKQLLIDENLYQMVDFDTSYNLKSWKALLTQFKKQFKFAILESEKSDKQVFLIGEIRSPLSKAVTIKYFTGAGQWDKNPKRMFYSDITSCQVNSNYINVYHRYFKRTDLKKSARR